MLSLEGKTAFITGGAGGIGAAIAADFVKAGASVVIADRDPRGKTVAAEMGAAGFVQVDVTDDREIERAFDQAVAIVGKLDIVVNNAGIGLDLPPLDESNPELERKVLDVNLRGVMYGLMFAPARMNDGGSIINAASVAGDGFTRAGSGSYSASKAGVVYLTRTSAIELGPRNIRVNAVSPAGIKGTGMSPNPAVIEALTALGREGSVDEVVPVYRFLAADESSFVTGSTVKVDGGMTAGASIQVFDLMFPEE